MLRIALARRRLTILIGVASPGILASIVEYLITGGISGLVPAVCAIIGGFGTFGVLLYVEKQLDSPDPDQSVDSAMSPRTQDLLPEPTDCRFFTPRTPAEMVAEQEGKTSIVAQDLGERHKGNWLKVEGAISNVAEWFGDLKVTLDSTQSQPLVFLDFDPTKWKTRLKTLDEGDRIVAVGKIGDVNDKWVSLENCELIQVVTDYAAIEESRTE